MSGWVKLHRCLLNKAIWKTSSAEHKAILITLLTMANHKENEWEWQGKKFVCKPGQFITSAKSIAEKAGDDISRQNIRGALSKFEKYEFLTKQATKQGMLITIINWELYQSNENEPTNEVTNSQPTTNQQPTTNKNDKKIKNDKKLKDICSNFDQFWASYPKKVAKGEALKSWNKINPDEPTLQTILNALEKAKQSKDWLKDNGQFIPYPSTWLNQKRWEDDYGGQHDGTFSSGTETRQYGINL